MMQTAYYIIPVNSISPIYELEKTACILIISIIIILSIFEIGRTVRIILTFISSITAFIHYYILYMLSTHETIIVLPLTVFELTSNGSVIGIDYGQILVAVLLYLWRDKISSIIKSFHRHNAVQNMKE